MRDTSSLLCGYSVTCYRCRYRSPTLPQRDETRRYLDAVQHSVSPSYLREYERDLRISLATIHQD